MQHASYDIFEISQFRGKRIPPARYLIETNWYFASVGIPQHKHYYHSAPENWLESLNMTVASYGLFYMPFIQIRITHTHTYIEPNQCFPISVIIYRMPQIGCNWSIQSQTDKIVDVSDMENGNKLHAMYRAAHETIDHLSQLLLFRCSWPVVVFFLLLVFLAPCCMSLNSAAETNAIKCHIGRHQSTISAANWQMRTPKLRHFVASYDGNIT